MPDEQEMADAMNAASRQMAERKKWADAQRRLQESYDAEIASLKERVTKLEKQLKTK